LSYSRGLHARCLVFKDQAFLLTAVLTATFIRYHILLPDCKSFFRESDRIFIHPTDNFISLQAVSALLHPSRLKRQKVIYHIRAMKVNTKFQLMLLFCDNVTS